MIIGLNINVSKVKHCSKRDFERFWGFVIMDRFETGSLIEGLLELSRVVDNNTFGRKPTALKRALTLVDREPELESWRTWVREAVIEADLALQLSPEQLRALIRLYRDPMTGLVQIVPTFLEQPFTHPLAVLLRVLDSFADHRSAEVRAYCLSAVDRIL